MYCNTLIKNAWFALFFMLLTPNLLLASETQFRIKLVKDIRAGGYSSNPHKIIDVSPSPLRTKAFFLADRTGYPNGYGLWETNGTEQGTQFIADIDIPDISGNYTEFTLAGDWLFFKAGATEDDYLGSELYKTYRYDTTQPDIYLVKDIWPGSRSSWPENLTDNGTCLLFFATTEAEGRELWRSDGTTPGTFMVKESVPGSGGVGYNGSKIQSVLVNGILYYDAFVPNQSIDAHTYLGGLELWRSDGTAEGTYLVKDLTPTYEVSYGEASWSRPSHLTYFRNALFYSSAKTDIGQELFYYDPTNTTHQQHGPQIIKDICPNDGITCGSSNGSYPSDFFVAGGFLFFLADDGIHGRELWVTNGTEAGTKMVIDLVPGDGSPSITQQTVFGNKLFFVYDDGDDKHGKELWSTGGTADSTELVKDIATGLDVFDHANDSDPQYLTVVGSYMYFSAWSPDYGRELWSTDGTTEGTGLVQEMNPSPIYGGDPSSLANINGTLFFNAESRDFLPDNPYTARELWKVALIPSKKTSILSFLSAIIKKK
jgi:ELWxxDGT repeat protein